MSAPTSASFFLVVCFLLCSCTAQEIITAVAGQDVILPCNATKNNNKTITAVEWIRPGLDPDYVLLYRYGRLDPGSQHPSYQNRVDLQDQDMKDGDVSLILKDVKMNDTGTYECYVSRGEITSKTINLEVVEPGNVQKYVGVGGNKDGGDKVGVIIGPVVILLLAVASVGFLVYRRHTRQNPNLPVPPDEAAAEIMKQRHESFPEQQQNKAQLV